MALGADDVESAALERDLALGGDIAANGADALVRLDLALDALGFALDAHFEVAAELDVGAAARHVGGYGDRARHTGLGDDVGLLLMIAGVQHLVRDLALLQQAGQMLRFFDADGADEHWLLSRPAFLDQIDDGIVFFARSAVDLVMLVDADAGQVAALGGLVDPTELVDVEQFVGFGGGRAGYAGELLVHPEIVLEGDRGERLVFGLDLDVLLGFQGLVQAL